MLVRRNSLQGFPFSTFSYSYTITFAMVKLVLMLTLKYDLVLGFFVLCNIIYFFTIQIFGYTCVVKRTAT